MKPSELIDKQIEDHPDWRGTLMARLRSLIHEADPDIQEEWKWSTAAWSHNGLVCSISVFKSYVKLNFLKGASLSDPHKLINVGLDARVQRAIDFHEGNEIREAELKELIREAVDLNR